MKKRKARKAAGRAPSNKIVFELKPKEVVRVVVPEKTKPVVISDPYTREVTVIAAPKETWLEYLFGTKKR